MKEDHINIELEPGLDGADTSDSDNARDAANGDDCIRAKQRPKRKPRRRATKNDAARILKD